MSMCVCAGMCVTVDHKSVKNEKEDLVINVVERVEMLQCLHITNSMLYQPSA